MKYHMSETDIVIDFKEAKDKKAMIQILLDQNPGVTREELLNLLESHGCKVGWFKADKAANFHRKKEESKEEKLISKIVVTEVEPEESVSETEQFDELPWVPTQDMPSVPESVVYAINTEIERLEKLISESQKVLEETKLFKAWLDKKKGS